MSDGRADRQDRVCYSAMHSQRVADLDDPAAGMRLFAHRR